MTTAEGSSRPGATSTSTAGIPSPRTPVADSVTLDFVDEYVAAAERFAVGIARSDLSAVVPACPDWSAYDLVVHLGNVHAWAATIVETGARAPEQFDAPRSRKPVKVSEWYAGKAEDLYEVLRSTSTEAASAEECWNFAGVNTTKAFWPRRQAYETLMHLVDLDQSAGRPTSLTPALCTDGIAEALEVFLPRMHARGYAAELSAPVTIRTVDTAHVWTLTPRHDAAPMVAVRTEPGADLVEGTAESLWRLLWKRPYRYGAHPDFGVSYVGNRDRIVAFTESRLTP